MDNLQRIAHIIKRLCELDDRLDAIDDRVSVLEDVTCNHESRLEDLEDDDDYGN